MCYIYRYKQNKILICIRKMDGTIDHFVKARLARLRKINSLMVSPMKKLESRIWTTKEEEEEYVT